MASEQEVFPWLKALPLAPEYRPTRPEFEDPIAYIFKIEKEASKYGICKIVPPLAAPPKKRVVADMNRSLLARPGSSEPTFTTRQQQIGFCPRRHCPVQKPVWQSGESYTLSQFKAKAKGFEKNFLKKSPRKGLSALEIETHFWEASGDKPFSVEYANDIPGSAFAPVGVRSEKEAGEGVTVGETAWNMRGVSRAKGSLLRFMKAEIPGVMSPMVYVAMMFSWFAWHVEDHDLHSLNYLHMGAGKTWYGVPREAAVAFEEVVRVHGYGGEINPLVTFAVLGEKTTVMSPEVLIGAGVPCCRLVQNVGEFVVTFPRAYHSGFSHGFNCSEAANIATPEWLRVAKDAAIRRASIKCPPMVSHFQLLYDLALSLCSRIPNSISTEPRSSRLKNKKKGEGEIVIKELFVEDVMRNNDLLHILGEGSSVVLLPQTSLDNSVCSDLFVSSQLKGNPRLSFGLSTPKEKIKASDSLVSRSIMVDRMLGVKQLAGFYPVKGRFSSMFDGNRLSKLSGSHNASWTHKVDTGRERTAQGDSLSDQGLFSCVTCGILCFACVAIVQPREAAANYLMSADCSIFNDQDVGPMENSDGSTVSTVAANLSQLNSYSGRMGNSTPDSLFDVPIHSAEEIQIVQQSAEVDTNTETQKAASALGQLAINYGNSSDSDEEEVEADIPVYDSETKSRDCSPVNRLQFDNRGLPSLKHHRLGFGHDVPLQVVDSYEDDGRLISNFKGKYQTFDCSAEFQTDNIASIESNSVGSRNRYQMKLSTSDSNGSQVTQKAVTSRSNVIVPSGNATVPFAPRSDKDSSRLHVFCLQHASEVEQQLRPIGGAHIMLLCHPDYPELENEAKLVAEELGIDYCWNDVAFREADEEDEERIQLALESDVAVHGNGDWAVKLGIHLYYSANLSRSPLYRKQMPYSSIIYKAFGSSALVNSVTKPKVYERRSSKQKKIVVAGKWCGKVWMSNQVHPLLAGRDTEDVGEEGRTFHAQAKREVKHERFSESTLAAETISAIRKTGKKRKSTREAGAMMKLKYQKMQELGKASEDSPDEGYDQQYKRNIRSKNGKSETPRSERSCDPNARRFELCIEDELDSGPSTCLRKRSLKPSKDLVLKKLIQSKPILKKKTISKKANKSPAVKTLVAHNNTNMRDEEGEYTCDMEGCTMSFDSKQELVLHKRNVCPVKGCGKKFFSHKYLVQHRRVHVDDRPLKCPWKGCKRTFKWAWARTEHIRVHTGERPYVCTEAGCGQTFRFVSDFSRHKRKTGHHAKKGRG
ncbi:Lysine-specific demethylase [Actinidia chinensis var. chinensis]|uniref:Lysine-specific demethylase n=1 Tax=Actinidia chinensis var. chinensis TaxID=1590841 RepID=A0A2R6PUP2_ACTCC|nr:Lysine-specific demethylase [Actinidia chinensis var. chinensis]